MSTPTYGMPPVDDFIDFEQGEMDEARAIEFLQRLIDTGLAWQLQGFYGRTCMRAIEAGYCNPPARN